jgi:ADP-ribose pyrophosphatase YjhB (NUDIX family)
MELSEELASRLSAIAAVARTGLAWSPELYERERYERILELAAQMATILTENAVDTPPLVAEELKMGWLAQVKPGAPGYVTPKISTGAAVFDKENRMLLGKRGDSGMWFFPTGWQEVGLTPAENVVKEVQEETGIECRPIRLIGVRDTRLHQRGPTDKPTPNPFAIHNIALTFLCEALSSEIKVHPLETQDAKFFTEEEALKTVPSQAVALIQQCFQAWRGEFLEPFFDQLNLE